MSRIDGRQWLLGCGVIVLSVLVALVLGEIALRLAGLQSTLVYQPNPYFGWSLTAGDRFTRSIDGRNVDIEINSRGLRDYEYEYSKQPGTYRILILGDSFTEAFQVPLERTYAKRLEEGLRSVVLDEPTAFEVIGSGVSGYGTDNEYLFYLHEGKEYAADLVVVALYIGNDIRNNWYELDIKDSGGLRKPYFTLDGGKLTLNHYPFEPHASLKTRLKVFLNRNSLIYSTVREVGNRFRHKKRLTSKKGRRGIPLDANLFATEYSPAWNTAWEVSREILVALRDEVERNGSELLVMLIPTRAQVHRQYWQELIDKTEDMQDRSWNLDRPNEMLAQFSRDSGISILDLMPVLRNESEATDEEYYLENDGHFNRKGHELAAESLLDYVIELARSR